MQSLANGSHFGGYAILRLVGRGGMGEVYEAFEHKLQRHVALKIVSSGDDNHEELVGRFLQEARTLARVNHPNVVTIYAIDRVEETQYIAMEFVDGVALKELLRGQELSTDEALPLFEQMLEGLKCLHENKIIHRDLKPHNVLVRADLQVKILDFGIAKAVGEASEHTVAGVVVGTIPYMPPEVKVGIPANIQSDIWSLGAIFYECLTGQQLAKMMSGRSDHSTLIFPEDVEAAISEPIKAFLSKMCAFKPVDRFQSAEAALFEARRIKAERQKVPSEVFEALEKRVSRIVEISRTDSEKQLKAIQASAANSLNVISKNKFERRSKPRDSEKTKNRTLNVEKVPYQWVAVAVGIAILLGSIYGMINSKEPVATVKETSSPHVAESSAITAPVVLTSPRDKQSMWLEPTLLPTFKWSRAVKAGEYQIQVAFDSDFQKIVIQEPVTGQFYRPAKVLEEAQYYWRLMPLDSSLPKVETRSFILSSTAPVQLSKPDSLHILSLRGQGTHAHLEFSWSCKPGAKTYRFQLSTNSTFGSTLSDRLANGCQENESRLSAGTYFWRVRAEDLAIPPQEWSEVRKFVVINGVPNRVADRELELGEPKVLSPKTRIQMRLTADGRSLASLAEGGNPVALSWTEVPGAKGYLVQLSKSQSFSELLIEENTSNPQFIWRYPVPGKTFWRVRAHSSEREVTKFSGRGEIEVLIPAPRLASKFSIKATKNQTHSLVGWPPVPTAERYLVQTSASRELANVESHLSKEASFKLKSGSNVKFLRVAAADLNGEPISPFSNLATIEIASAPVLGFPKDLMPKNGARAPARGGRISIVFSWSPVANATSYQLEVARDEEFSDLIERRQSSNEKSILKQAELSGRVYWRVRAVNSDGLSEWSEPTFFEVK